MSEVIMKELEVESVGRPLQNSKYGLGHKISTLHLYFLFTRVKESGSLVSKNIPKMLCSWENGEQIATLNENEPNFNSEKNIYHLFYFHEKTYFGEG